MIHFLSIKSTNWTLTKYYLIFKIYPKIVISKTKYTYKYYILYINNIHTKGNV